ncbi:MAG: hypothetical protein ACE5H6_04100 [Dehalococcoidia bacterium]
MTEERTYIYIVEGDRATEFQEPIASLRAEKSAWAEVVAGVKERQATPEAPPPPAVEEQVPKKGEMTTEDDREWKEKLLAAGRYSRERRGVWGIDRKISPKIRVTVDKRMDRQIDRSVGDKHVRHRIRRSVNSRVHRGAGRIKGVNPFRRGA